MTRVTLTALLVTIAFIGCSRSHAPVSRQSTAMNTYITVTIYDEDIENPRAEALIDSAFAEIRRVENFATDYSDSSEVGRVNLAAGKDSLRVSEELIDLVRAGIGYGDQSGGKLDITVGPLAKAWNFLAEHPRVLTRREADSLLPLVNYRSVHINGRYLFLPQKGMRLDLGSIGKGWAIERAADVLRRAGVRKFIVDIGGKLKIEFQGSHLLDSAVADVSVRHPRKTGEYLGHFMMGSGAVSTSGDYERFFIQNGIRYHHLLDPATGFPLRGVAAVTVITQDAFVADALSTVVFLLGREQGMQFMRNTPGLDGMITYEDGDSLKSEMTERLAKAFRRERSNAE